MLWNIFMHILIGLLGTQHFTLTLNGLLFSLLIVAFTQGADLFRVYLDGKKKIESGPVQERKVKMEKFKKELPKVLPGIFAQNMLMYTAIVLFSAEIGRSTGYGV